MRLSLGSYLLSVCLLARLTAPASAQDNGRPDPTLPPVVVTAPEDEPQGEPFYDNGDGTISWSSDAIYSDTQRVGPYNQPVWTTQRPFAASRVYVLPAGQMQVEQWVRPTYRRNDKTRWRFLEEYAIGLPHRFQLDLYERWNVEPNDQNQQQANHEGIQVELRYALADWGVIPFNPTLYAEWIEKGGPQDKPNVFEFKLLLAEELLPNLYYASNIVMEQETADEREQEWQWSNSFATTVVERKLMAGIEMLWSSTTVTGSRGDQEIAFSIGPALQYRPTNRIFLDVSALFGTTQESPHAQLYFILGYQFGSRAAPSGVSGPASTRGN